MTTRLDGEHFKIGASSVGGSNNSMVMRNEMLRNEMVGMKWFVSTSVSDIYRIESLSLLDRNRNH